MKYSPIFCLLIMFAYACNNNLQTKLVNEQRLLKDSANNLNESIGTYLQNGIYDKAKAQQKQLSAVHTRLIAIQSSLDSVATLK